MYIRIQQQSIRYRLSREEASRLIVQKELMQKTILTNDASIEYKINITKKPNHFIYRHKINQFLLSINQHDIEKELSDRPSKQGIVFQQPSDKILQHQLKISLEIDIKKPGYKNKYKNNKENKALELG